MVVSLINGLFSAIGSVVAVLLGLLPDSPFVTFSDYLLGIDSQYFALARWLLPLNFVAALLEVWIIAVLVYYGIRIVMRWFKIAGGGA